LVSISARTILSLDQTTSYPSIKILSAPCSLTSTSIPLPKRPVFLKISLLLAFEPKDSISLVFHASLHAFRMLADICVQDSANK